MNNYFNLTKTDKKLINRLKVIHDRYAYIKVIVILLILSCICQSIKGYVSNDTIQIIKGFYGTFIGMLIFYSVNEQNKIYSIIRRLIQLKQGEVEGSKEGKQ